MNLVRAPRCAVPASRHGLLVILTLCSAVAVVDRQIVSILQEPIKHELGLSDTQLGLLTGLGFAFFYAAMAIPFGRLADRTSRRNLIAGSLFAWSGLTALSGVASNFTQLLVARIGVAVGEASITPASTSIIADTYSPEKLASATAFYTNGYQIGLLAGFVGGGWLGEALGWRGTLMVAAIPGVILAMIVRFDMADPSRRTPEKSPMALASGLREVARSRTLRWLTLAISLSTMAAYALISWSAPYLIRVHGFGVRDAGLWLALGFGIGGFAGNLGAGMLVDRLGRRDRRWCLWIPGLISVLMIPFCIIAFTSRDSSTVALALLVPFSLIVAHSGICMSMVNRITPPTFRGTTIAIYLLVTNIFGLGAGATLVGVLSDLGQDRYGINALGVALGAVVTMALAAAVAPYLLAARHLARDLGASA